MKYSFYDDYSEGVHPKILEYITAHNNDQQLTYGRDEYTKHAAERIKKALVCQMRTYTLCQPVLFVM